MKTITKLALTRITTRKARSGVICASILLTIVLFMTVVSISVNIFNSYSLMMRLANGTDYHGYLRTASFTISGEALRDAALASNDIAEAAISTNLAQYALQAEKVPTSLDSIRALEKAEDLAHFYTDITEGRFPMADNEILVNPRYFPETKVGDTLGLYYSQQNGNYAQSAYAEFTVTGLIHCRADAQLQVVMGYSDTLLDTYRFTGQNANVYFMFDNRINLVGKYTELVNETLGDYKADGHERYGGLNSAYLEAAFDEVLNLATVLLILFAVAVVFFCSFLLIYNIYAIALTQDMQTFGLLSVIGTTHKQLRQMTVLQSLFLFAVTAPVGMVAGYFIGWKLLSPVLFTSLGNEGLTFAFSLWIPVLTLALALFTLLWSATRPLAKLQTMTPIATVDYNPTTDLPVHYVNRKNYRRKNVTPSTGRLAGYSISRNRKKTVISALSMSLSVVLFVLLSTLCNYMIEYTEKNMQFADYIVKPYYTYHYEGDAEDVVYTNYVPMDGGRSLTPETIAAVEALPSLENIWKIRVHMDTMPTPANVRQRLAELRDEYKYFDNHPTLTQALAGTMRYMVVSIPDELFLKILPSDTSLEAYGEDVVGSVIWKADQFYMQVWEGDVLTKESKFQQIFWFRDGDSVQLGSHIYPVRHSTALPPTLPITDYISNWSNRPTVFMPESAFLAEFGEGMIHTLLVDAKEGYYDSLRQELEGLNEGFTVAINQEIYDTYQREERITYTREKEIQSYSISISGRMDGMNQMKNTIAAIQTVGYSLVSMIFLVGVLNIVNTALSSVSERKREFAMLEAVGMTDRQLLGMLLLESLCGGSVSMVLTVCIGFPLIQVFINTAMDALVSLDWLSGCVMLGVCIAVSMASGVAVFRLTKSASVVERIQID